MNLIIYLILSWTCLCLEPVNTPRSAIKPWRNSAVSAISEVIYSKIKMSLKLMPIVFLNLCALLWLGMSVCQAMPLVLDDFGTGDNMDLGYPKDTDIFRFKLPSSFYLTHLTGHFNKPLLKINKGLLKQRKQLLKLKPKSKVVLRRLLRTWLK